MARLSFLIALVAPALSLAAQDPAPALRGAARPLPSNATERLWGWYQVESGVGEWCFMGILL
jgi:hypothetical protein